MIAGLMRGLAGLMLPSGAILHFDRRAPCWPPSTRRQVGHYTPLHRPSCPLVIRVMHWRATGRIMPLPPAIGAQGKHHFAASLVIRQHALARGRRAGGLYGQGDDAGARKARRFT